MKALVTGGGGFLGATIAQMLHTRGYDVAVLGRHPYPDLEQSGIRTIRADVRDHQAVRAACAGAEAVFHCAAKVGIWGPRRDFWQVNVCGTQNVIDACRAQDVGKLIYTSSPSVVLSGAGACGADESAPYPRTYLAHYPASKAEAERRVLAANSGPLRTVALRPHLIWGPRDPHLIPRVLERARQGRLLQVGSGRNRVDLTYIDNAAQAHIAAAEALNPRAACAGRAYFISDGEPVELWPWLNHILARVGSPPIRHRVPYAAAYAVGAVCEWAFAFFGLDREPPMTRFLASQLAKSHYFNIAAARRDLSYAPVVSPAEGTERLVASLNAQKRTLCTP